MLKKSSKIQLTFLTYGMKSFELKISSIESVLQAQSTNKKLQFKVIRVSPCPSPDPGQPVYVEG